MVDIYSRPTEQDLKKAKEIYGDPLIYAVVNSTIKALNEFQPKEYSEVLGNEFIRIARQLIYYKGLDFTLNLLQEAIAQASDEFYENNTLPPMDYYFKKKKQHEKKDYGKSIIEIAEKYGLEIKKNKCVCPFHADSSPSLTFYPKTNSFYCFGCGVGGDIITFIQKIEALNEKE